MSQSKLDLMDLRSRQRAASEQKMLGGIEALRRGAFDIESLRDRQRKQAIEDELLQQQKKDRTSSAERARLDLLAEGVARGAIPIVEQKVGDGTFARTVVHPKDRRTQILALAKERAPSLLAEIGEEGVLSLLGGAQADVALKDAQLEALRSRAAATGQGQEIAGRRLDQGDRRLRLQEEKAPVQIEAMRARTDATREKTTQNAASAQRKAATAAVSSFVTKVGTDNARTEAAIEDAVKAAAEVAPDLTEIELRGIATNLLVDEQYRLTDSEQKKASAKFERELKEEKFRFDKWKSKTTNLSDTTIRTVGNQLHAIEGMGELSRLARDPDVKFQNAVSGAAQQAGLLGSGAKAIFNPDNIERILKVQRARAEGDNKTLEFINRSERTMFMVARALNAGVITDNDLAFWKNALFDPTFTREQYLNGLDSTMALVDSRLRKDLDTYSQTARQLPKEWEAYRAGAPVGAGAGSIRDTDKPAQQASAPASNGPGLFTREEQDLLPDDAKKPADAKQVLVRERRKLSVLNKQFGPHDERTAEQADRLAVVRKMAELGTEEILAAQRSRVEVANDVTDAARILNDAKNKLEAKRRGSLFGESTAQLARDVQDAQRQWDLFREAEDEIR